MKQCKGCRDEPLPVREGHDQRSAIDAAMSPAVPARFLAGGTNLIDLMREGVEQPRRRRSISPGFLGRDRGRPDGGVRVGAMVRNSHLASHPVDPRAISVAVLRRSERSIRTASQHGDNRRQSHAADALLLLLRHGDALQQARAWQRLRRARRFQPDPRDPGRILSVHRDASVRHVCRAGRARCRRQHRGPQGARVVPFADFHRLPGETPDVDTICCPAS